MGNTLNLQTNEPSDLGEEPEWVHNDVIGSLNNINHRTGKEYWR